MHGHSGKEQAILGSGFFSGSDCWLAGGVPLRRHAPLPPFATADEVDDFIYKETVELTNELRETKNEKQVQQAARSFHLRFYID
jgi:hypothetical protein